MSKEQTRHLALELERLTAKLCRMCADVNHPAADDAVDYLTLAQSAVLRLSQQDKERKAYTIGYNTASDEDYSWLAEEFNSAWEG